jgi:thiaminase
MVLQIASDTQLHKDFFAAYGIPIDLVEATREEPELVAFTRYVFDVGLSGDDFMLGVALTPCVVGYGEIGMGLKATESFEGRKYKGHDTKNRIRLDGNPYQQ